MCHQCKEAPTFARRRVPKGRNSFSYFFRRSVREDADRKSYYMSLLDEIRGSDHELAIRLSSKIADIQEDFRERLPEWLRDPLERLTLRAAYCYCRAESALGEDARFVLQQLTTNLPRHIFDDLVHGAHDATKRRPQHVGGITRDIRQSRVKRESAL